MATANPRLTNAAATALSHKLKVLTEGLPGSFLAVASQDDLSFFSQSYGPLDVIKGPDAGPVSDDTIIWLSSATRFVIALAYLQLVDQGKISLDSLMSDFSSELAETSKQILKGFDAEDKPIYVPAEGKITLRTMLNGTSGFAPEFNPIVGKFKSVSERGKGSVNSCKAENLIFTPPCAQPGEKYEYGTSADWLSFIFPKVAGQDLESYLQKNVFEPLGMSSATFYPYDSDLSSRVMPLRWLAGTGESGNTYEDWKGQQAVHLLPKKKADMEYPVGGAGLYAPAKEYIRLLQNILIGAGDQQPSSFTAILSSKSYELLLKPDLTVAQADGVSGMMNGYFNLGEGDVLIGPEDANVSLGDVIVYTGWERKAGWGRRPGSAGWGGAAGTDFYIDPATGIAVIFSTQLLPGSGPVVKNLKKSVERALYEALDASA